jgi:hypothetical protein
MFATPSSLQEYVMEKKEQKKEAAEKNEVKAAKKD